MSDTDKRVIENTVAWLRLAASCNLSPGTGQALVHLATCMEEEYLEAA